MSQSRTPTSRNQLTSLLTIVVATTVLLAFSLALYARWQPSGASLPKNIISNSVPFKLDPSRHSSRGPATLTYHWRISSDERRPDGVLKRVFLINEEFPGPTIEARPGDRLVVEVENALYERNESVSIHWHGLRMFGHNSMDGAAGITQDPVPAGQNFTYDFTIADDQFGTFWYHAHSAVQRADGLYGGLVVHEPSPQGAKSTARPDEHLLMIGDWYHRTAEEVLAWYVNADSFGMEPVPDSILINGDGRFRCADAVPARPLDCQTIEETLASLHFDASRPSLLRLVNVGAYTAFSIGINHAHLRITTVDGGNKVDSSISDKISLLYPGERINVFLNDWAGVTPQLNITLPSERYRYSNPALSSEQVFDISLANQRQTQGANTDLTARAISLDLLKPSSAESISPAETTLVLYTMTEKLAHLDYEPHGNINRTIWQPQSPHLLSLHRSAWNDKQFIPRIPYRPMDPLWVDLVVNNLDEEDHPFHLHGHDFYVMSTFSSSTNWGSYNPFDGSTPPGGPYVRQPLKKDTVAVPRRGYAVLRFRADNPGVWMFHCHVIWHFASGMAMGFDVR
ncbi:hypothetical protein AMS68_004919 [Peltaster fructicola]|uniref:Multicopper oxidase n=1 Tax=Peltaster fructicola TaxID=286661 RepID=A0A6H0XXA3_9PEZI|nr:hypothetical protein AMS68_004919 [Peltaster fructicola]